MTATRDRAMPLKEASRVTGWDYQLLYRLVRSGDIRATDLGVKRSSWYVTEQDIEDYMASRRSA